MRKLVLKSDHSVEITRTYERLYGSCVISDPVSPTEFQYDGMGTDVDWNSQEQVTRNGELVFLDEDGDEYLESELEVIEC